MYYEENDTTYVENGRGCCGLVRLELRRQRHLIVISLLIILSLVSILIGLYYGLTFKKYSNWAVIVGIFFPSVIIVFTCIYLAFIFGRESLRTHAVSRHSSNGQIVHHSQDTTQRHPTRSAVPRNLKVRYQPNVNAESTNDSTASNYERNCDRPFCVTYVATDNCKPNVSKRHFSSSSYSSSKKVRKNSDPFAKQLEMCNVDYKRKSYNRHSVRFRKYKTDVNHQRRVFKRSVSDTTNKNRNKISRENMYIRNSQSLVNLKRSVGDLNVVKDIEQRSDCSYSSVELKRQTRNFHLWKNAAEQYKEAKRFKSYRDGIKKYRGNQDYVDIISKGDTGNQNCNTKIEINISQSDALKLPCEYKHSHFSNFPQRKDVSKGIRDTSSCSSKDVDKNGSFIRIKRSEMSWDEERIKNSSFEQDTRRLRNKAAYLPSTSCKDLKQPSRRCAHEFCRYSRNTKMAH